MKKQVTLSAIALATAFTATSAFAGMTVAEKDDGKLELSGKAFLGFQSVDKSGTKTLGGNVDRFYFQAKYKKNDWYARITTDVNNEQSQKDSNGDTKNLKRNMNVFLKYAYIERSFSDAAQLRLGLSHTPWIDYEQGLWGHRFVSKVTSDHFGFDSSADYGVGLKGKLADKMVEYWVTATNGGGYGEPNQTGALDINSRVTIKPIDGLDVSLQYRTGYKGKKTTSTVNIADKDTMTQLMASYKVDGYRIGANTISVKNLKTAAGDDRTATAIWGTAKFNKEFGAFAKVESMDNNGTKTDHQVIGVDYFMDKGLTMSFAYDNEKTGSAKTTKMGVYSLVKF